MQRVLERRRTKVAGPRAEERVVTGTTRSPGHRADERPAISGGFRSLFERMELGAGRCGKTA